MTNINANANINANVLADLVNELNAVAHATAAADIALEGAMGHTDDEREEHVCDHCGQVTDSVRTVIDQYGNEEEWCDECVAREATECERCGELHETEGLVTVYDDCGNELQWCEDCAERHAQQCEHCGTWYTNDVHLTDVVVCDTWRYGREYESWCDDCVDRDTMTCDDCDTVYADNVSTIDIHYVYGRGEVVICDHCGSDYYTCQDCGDWVYADDVEWIDGDAYCPNCAENNVDYSESIHRYGHTRGAYFWQDNGDRVSCYGLTPAQAELLYLGIELEVDDLHERGDAAETIVYEFSEDHVVCKEDGSLGCRGFEIVSQPMTPHYTLTSGMWERITDVVKAHDGRSHDAGTCGLHIHLSRSYFVDYDAVYRLDRMFHRFERQLVRFSRRRGGDMRWCSISNDDDLAEIEDAEERKEVWKSKKSRAGRYVAVNVTNERTVEIRLWRGTLNMETLRATIELTTGMAIIANTMSDELAEKLTWKMLCMFVRYALEQQGLPHDDFDAYLTRRGL